MSHNFLIPVIDTDSLTISKSDGSEFSQKEIDNLTEEINSLTDELIIWEYEFYIPQLIVIKSKNYILDYGDEVKIKGSSMRDQKKEPALREMLNNIILSMLNRIEAKPVDIYKKYIQEALDIKDITRWSTKKTVSEKVLNCAKSKDVRKNEMDVWEAIKEENAQAGDKIHLYPVILGENIIPGGISAKTGKPLKDKVEIITGLKLSKYWTNDHNVDHLVKRVFATVKIFKNVLDMDQFIDYSKKSNKHLLEELKQEVINLNISKLEIEDDESDESSEE